MAMDSNRTLEKGIEMLFQFTEQNPIRSVKDIITELDLPRSTAYRLLDTLKNKKMIQEHGSGRYRLGLSILQLAKIATVGMDLVNLAAPKYRIDSAKEQAIIQQLLPNAIKLNEQMKLLGIDCI
jgi:predicted transcriptional regulator